MADKILLQNGCSMSTPSVNPKNWETGGRELLKKNWQIQYYFYDPEFAETHPYGKLIAVRGMNDFKTLKDRRDITRGLIEQEINACLNGYNHFTKSYIGENEFDYEIEPNTGFIKALWKACDLLNVCNGTLSGVKTTIRHIEKSAKQLRIHEHPICEIKRRNVKACLDLVEKKSKSESNYRYNRNRAHLHMLFKILVEYETIDTNIIRDISKRVEEKKQREIISVEQFKEVQDYLLEENYNFYRYAMIFFLAGVRSTELLSVKKKHVDFENREYKVLIKKGKQYVWETKAIILPAIKFWKEILKECESEEYYLFSDNFEPGIKKAYSKKPSRWWKENVKNTLGITADFYTLKHLFLDLVDEQNTSDYDQAKGMASHRTSSMTDVYRTGKKKRELEKLKQINISV